MFAPSMSAGGKRHFVLFAVRVTGAVVRGHHRDSAMVAERLCSLHGVRVSAPGTVDMGLVLRKGDSLVPV